MLLRETLGALYSFLSVCLSPQVCMWCCVCMSLKAAHTVLEIMWRIMTGKIYLSLISHFMMANIFPSIFTVGFVQVYKSKILSPEETRKHKIKSFGLEN